MSVKTHPPKTTKASPQAEAFAKRHNTAVSSRKKRGRKEAREYRELLERVPPTPERIAKGDIEQQAAPGSVPYRAKSTFLEIHEGKWPDLEGAFRRLLDDSAAADVNGVTANYDPSGVRVVGPRLGGLGDARATKVRAYARYIWVKERLTVRSRQMCEELILESARGGTAAALQRAGGRLAPHIKSNVPLQYIAMGRLLGAGDELIKLYAEYDMRERFETVVGESRR